MNREGQALLELLGCVLILILAFTGAGRLFQSEWNRLKCAYLVFDIGHKKLTQESNESQSPGLHVNYRNGSVTIQAQGDGIVASAQCGEAHESVRLQNLESSL